MRVFSVLKGARRTWLVFCFIAFALIALEHFVFYEKDAIVIDAARRDALISKWQAKTKRLPTNEEKEALFKQYSQDEMMFREALRLGLNEDDTIIKRRLIQKLRFLYEESHFESVSLSELRAFYKANQANYVLDEQYSFYHLFYSKEPSKSDLDRIFQELDADDQHWQQKGEASMLARSYANRSFSDIKALFGTDFSNQLKHLAVGKWSGPIHSVYGAHIVYMVHRVPKKERDFDQVLPLLKADYQQFLTKKRVQEKVQALSKRYQILYSHDAR